MIEYTKEELRLFANKYLWGEIEQEPVLKCLFNVLFDSNALFDNKDYKGWLSPEDQYYFQIPYDRVPLLINCDNSLGKLVAKWRMDICR